MIELNELCEQMHSVNDWIQGFIYRFYNIKKEVTDFIFNSTYVFVYFIYKCESRRVLSALLKVPNKISINLSHAISVCDKLALPALKTHLKWRPSLYHKTVLQLELFLLSFSLNRHLDNSSYRTACTRPRQNVFFAIFFAPETFPPEFCVLGSCNDDKAKKAQGNSTWNKSWCFQTRRWLRRTQPQEGQIRWSLKTKREMVSS